MTPPSCINQINPRGGLCLEHSQFCAYPHRDGELNIKVTAVSHAHFNISKDRPNGTSCKNVCAWHSEYFLDRDGKKRKHESAIFISGEPIIDPRASEAMKSSSSTAVNWNPKAADEADSPSPTTKEKQMKKSSGTSKTKVKSTTKAKASNKARNNGKAVDLSDPDIALLASYQDKAVGGVKTIERMTANAMVSIFRKIKAATKAKPVVHAKLNAYDKRLARELARLGLVLKETIEGTGLAYLPNPKAKAATAK